MKTTTSSRPHRSLPCQSGVRVLQLRHPTCGLEGVPQRAHLKAVGVLLQQLLGAGVGGVQLHHLEAQLLADQVGGGGLSCQDQRAGDRSVRGKSPERGIREVAMRSVVT